MGAATTVQPPQCIHHSAATTVQPPQCSALHMQQGGPRVRAYSPLQAIVRHPANFVPSNVGAATHTLLLTCDDYGGDEDDTTVTTNIGSDGRGQTSAPWEARQHVRLGTTAGLAAWQARPGRETTLLPRLGKSNARNHHPPLATPSPPAPPSPHHHQHHHHPITSTNTIATITAITPITTTPSPAPDHHHHHQHQKSIHSICKLRNMG
ncbi:unnamed protein product [Closterium sp. NIES-54]